MTSSEAPSPEDAFALVGNEIRAEILQVMADAKELSFTELRSQLDGDLTPSQLHYHLQQLVGFLVQKSGEGYKLRPEGLRVNWALRSVTLPRRWEHIPVAANFGCYYCHAPVEAMFERGHARIQCPDCEYQYLDDPILISFEQFEDETTAFAHFSRFTQQKILAYARGICTLCGNTVKTEMLTPNHLPQEKEEHRKVAVHQTCNYCGVKGEMTLGMALLADQELRSFCLDYGVDIFTTTYWKLEFAATDKHVTVLSTDPWKVALRVTYDSDMLELIVDGDLTVIERNRRGTSSSGSPSSLSGVQSGGSSSDSGGGEDDVILPDNAACVQALRRHRWPDEVTCPHCVSVDTTKYGTTSKNAQRYRCHGCERIFNDLTGTIFAERGLSLPELFYIVRAMDETTTQQIARQLDRSYESVLDFVHKVEDAQNEDGTDDLLDVWTRMRFRDH